jgi:hypothetical protein
VAPAPIVPPESYPAALGPVLVPAPADPLPAASAAEFEPVEIAVPPAAAVGDQSGDTAMLPMPDPEWRPERELPAEAEFQSEPEWPLTREAAPIGAFADAGAEEQPQLAPAADDRIEETIVLTLADLAPKAAVPEPAARERAEPPLPQAAPPHRCRRGASRWWPPIASRWRA